MSMLVIVSTIAVLVGVFPMPFGYYTLLRSLLCLTGAMGCSAARQVADETWAWTLGAAAVFYNPILPVHLGSKPLWIALNLATVCLYWVAASRFRRDVTK